MFSEREHSFANRPPRTPMRPGVLRSIDRRQSAKRHKNLFSGNYLSHPIPDTREAGEEKSRLNCSR